MRVRGVSLEVILWGAHQSVTLDSIEMSAPPNCAYLVGRMINSRWHGAWCAAESPDSPTHKSNAWIYREIAANAEASTARQICIPAGCEPIGISYDSTLEETRYVLLAISPDRKHLLSIGPSRDSRTMFTSISNIVSAGTATDSDLVALLTQAEDLVVLRGSGQELFRWNAATTC